MVRAGGRLSRKYALVLGCLVSGALIISGTVHGYFAFLAGQDALVRVLRAEARAAAVRIADFADEIERQVRSVSDSPRPAGDVASEQRRVDYLRLLRLHPAIAELAHVDSDGREQLRVSLGRPTVVGGGEDRSVAPFFTETRSGVPYWSPVYFQRGSQPFTTIAFREPGPSSGFTVAEINLKPARDIVSQISVGRAGYAYVTDARGQLIAHPDLSLVLRRTDVSGLQPVQEARRTGAAGHRPVTLAPDLEGRTVLSVSDIVHPVGWLVVVSQPVEEALAPLYAVVWRTALLVLLGVALSLFASVLLARRMVAPIQALQGSAARIGAGELDQRIHLRTGDELEALAEELNHMSAQLRESYSGLEAKVDERTRELAAAVQALGEKSRQLEIASHHKTEFLANMSHELRTPLNAIIGFTEVLIDRPSGGRDERERRYLANILTAARHLLALINEILDVAKVEAGRMDLEIHRFSTAQAIESSLVWIQERAARNRIELNLEVDPRLGMIEADERKVKQVLVNLLTNAVKFTPEGGRIDVRAWRSADEALFEVRDTGIGLSQADVDRVFTAFEQVGGQAPGHREGTGLGLAISRRYVELHGGRIWVDSVPGVGSTFTLAIPVSQRGAEVAPTAPLPEPIEPASSSRDEWLSVASSAPFDRRDDAGRPRILVIDNHPLAVEVVDAVLQPEGYRVISALSGEQGVQLARVERPSMIILDLLMPDLDGFGVLQRLKEDPTTADIPIVILTSKTLSMEERARLAGRVESIAQKGAFDRVSFVELVRRHAGVSGGPVHLQRSPSLGPPVPPGRER